MGFVLDKPMKRYHILRAEKPGDNGARFEHLQTKSMTKLNWQAGISV
jgi:hypothetical protein